MNRQINLAESALPHYFAYFVVLALSFWRLTSLSKTRLNLAFQSCNNPSFRRQILIGHHRGLGVDPIVVLGNNYILPYNRFVTR